MYLKFQTCFGAIGSIVYTGDTGEETSEVGAVNGTDSRRG